MSFESKGEMFNRMERQYAESAAPVQAVASSNVPPQCECADPGCPAHVGVSGCGAYSVGTVFRADMEDLTGTWMCEACGNDALESGPFVERHEDDDEDEA